MKNPSIGNGHVRENEEDKIEAILKTAATAEDAYKSVRKYIEEGLSFTYDHLSLFVERYSPVVGESEAGHVTLSDLQDQRDHISSLAKDLKHASEVKNGDAPWGDDERHNHQSPKRSLR